MTKKRKVTDEKLKSRIWQIFWFRKTKEIARVLGIIFIPYLLGLWINTRWYNGVKGVIELWFTGLTGLMLAGILTGVIWLIGFAIWEVIQSNWKASVRQAKRELI